MTRLADAPAASVVIPTYNRASRLDVCLAGLVAQQLPAGVRFEVIVADDGSRDGTPSVVERFAGVRYLPLPHRGPNAARNSAIRVARGDLLCFVDDDVTAPRLWLATLLEGAARRPDAAALGGPMRLLWQGGVPRRCGAEPFGESELDLGTEEREVGVLHGGNMALRRWAVDLVGELLETRLPGLDEVELLDRLLADGLPVVYLPDAWVWHRRAPDQCRARSVVGRRFVRGIGQARALHAAGGAYRLDWEAQALRRSLRHAARERCWWGVVDAAQAAGRLAGALWPQRKSVR